MEVYIFAFLTPRWKGWLASRNSRFDPWEIPPCTQGRVAGLVPETVWKLRGTEPSLLDAENQTLIAWSSTLRSYHHTERIIQALPCHYRSQTENKPHLNHELITSAYSIRLEAGVALSR